jgi:hypothetical protein
MYLVAVQCCARVFPPRTNASILQYSVNVIFHVHVCIIVVGKTRWLICQLI